MTDLQTLLDQIHQIEKHTRPGPWELHPVNDSQLYATYVAGAEADPLEPEIAAVVSGFDAEFIALARTALPQLAKALRAVTKECARLKKVANNTALRTHNVSRSIAITQSANSVLEVLQEALGADDD